MVVWIPYRLRFLLAKWPNFAKDSVSWLIGASYSRSFRLLVALHPSASARKYSVYAQYTLQVDNRHDVQASLKKCGIPTAVHYPTLLCPAPALRCKQVAAVPGVRHLWPKRKSASNKSAYASMAYNDEQRVVDALVNVLQNNVSSKHDSSISQILPSFSATREVTQSSSYRHCGLGLCKPFLCLMPVGYRVLGFDIDHVKTDAINSGNSYIDHIDCSSC